MSEEPIDLNQFRQKKAEAAPACAFERVQLLACASCQNALFKLSHDNRVICATCNTWIQPLRWTDVSDVPA